MTALNVSLIIDTFSFAVMLVAILLCFIRMVKGPSLPDQVVALDLTVNIVISAIAIFAILNHLPVLIDVIIALALIIFLGTVSFAQLIEWRVIKQEKKHD